MAEQRTLGIARKKKDRRVYKLAVVGGREARVAPESEQGAGGSSRTVVRVRVLDQLPFDRLYRRETITHPQYVAADRMHSLYCLSMLIPVRAQALQIIQFGKSEDADSVYQAKEQYFKDLGMLEKRGRSLVHRVCGEAEQTPTDWAKNHGYSREYAIERLRECLNTIAERHGLG